MNWAKRADECETLDDLLALHKEYEDTYGKALERRDKIAKQITLLEDERRDIETKHHSFMGNQSGYIKMKIGEFVLMDGAV